MSFDLWQLRGIAPAASARLNLGKTTQGGHSATLPSELIAKNGLCGNRTRGLTNVSLLIKAGENNERTALSCPKKLMDSAGIAPAAFPVRGERSTAELRARTINIGLDCRIYSLLLCWRTAIAHTKAIIPLISN
jgi:hypothetical protein